MILTLRQRAIPAPETDAALSKERIRTTISDVLSTHDVHAETNGIDAHEGHGDPNDDEASQKDLQEKCQNTETYKGGDDRVELSVSGLLSDYRQKSHGQSNVVRSNARTSLLWAAR